MKPVLTILFTLILMLSNISVAHAVVCAKGVYRAGCAGPNGAVVTKKPVVVAPRPVVVAPRRPVVVTPAPRHCSWINGVRVCR
jgi:hypothetical protein